MSLCLWNKIIGNSFVKPSATLSDVEIEARETWADLHHCSSTKCLIFMCLVLLVVFYAFSISTATSLPSKIGVALSCSRSSSIIIDLMYKAIFAQSSGAVSPALVVLCYKVTWDLLLYDIDPSAMISARHVADFLVFVSLAQFDST